MANRIGEVVDAMQVLVRSSTCRQYDLNNGKLHFILEVETLHHRDRYEMLPLYLDYFISEPSKTLP